ncbi:MAG TPA: hypothetical protein PKD34_02330 [Candidatus Doudnabacteria bacterium]|nr:hypothetical protein [Candidatus Doudnabacteria bacterium]
MTQAVIEQILTESLEDLKVLMDVHSIPRSPMRRDSVRYFRDLILEHKKESIRAQLKQDRDSDIRYQREHGVNRVHSSQDEISEQEVYLKASSDLDLELERIRRWRKEGLNHEECVAKMHSFLEK